jgi:putative membrane protein
MDAISDHPFSPSVKMDDLSEEQKREVQAKMLVEKKTIINLLGAYAVSVKHYLRGEVGPGFQ